MPRCANNVYASRRLRFRQSMRLAGLVWLHCRGPPMRMRSLRSSPFSMFSSGLGRVLRREVTPVISCQAPRDAFRVALAVG